METIRSVMEWTALALDTFAVVVILVGVVVSIFRSRLLVSLLSSESPAVVSRFKHQLVNSLLLGLDLLVASDVIHTAALEPTIESVATLGLLVVVRIALTWSILVEAGGRWPWQGSGVES